MPLAIVAGQDHIETIDVILFSENELLNEFIIKPTSGRTPISDLRNSHRDISNLTYERLGIIKDFVLDSFKKKRTIRFTEKKLIKILKEAINHNRLNYEDLKEGILSCIQLFSKFTMLQAYRVFSYTSYKHKAYCTKHTKNIN